MRASLVPTPEIASAAFCRYSATWNASTTFIVWPVKFAGSASAMACILDHCEGAPSLAKTTFISGRSASTESSSSWRCRTRVALPASGMRA
jgi:hypothetical protein